MKTLKILALSFLCGAAYAQEPDRQALIAEALNDYGKVAGGWFINKRCNFISGEDLKTYEESVATITVALGQDLGNPSALFNIQAGAEKATQSEKYASCGELPKQIVEGTSQHARNWAAQIRKLQSVR